MIEAFTGISHRKYARSVEVGGLLPHNADGQKLNLDPSTLSTFNYFWYALPIIQELEGTRQGIAMQLLIRNIKGYPYKNMSQESAYRGAAFYGINNSICDVFFEHTGIYIKDSAFLRSIALSFQCRPIDALIANFERDASKLVINMGFEDISETRFRSVKAVAIKRLGSKKALLDLLSQIFAKPKAILVGWKTVALDSPRRIIPGHEDSTEIIIAAQDLIPLGDFSFEEV